MCEMKKWRISDSNRSPQTCHACALPDELIPLYSISYYRTRTYHLPECFRDALPDELIPLYSISYYWTRTYHFPECFRDALPDELIPHLGRKYKSEIISLKNNF